GGGAATAGDVRVCGDGGRGERGGLRDQEGERARDEPVERGENGEDRVEVVAQQVEARGFDRRLGGAEAGVAAYRLLEDAEVVAAGPQPQMPQCRPARVAGEQ